MVSKEPSSCALAPPDSEVEPAARLALEMRYALDPDRQVKKRNKALQVRFKDICEAQSERGQPPPPGPGPGPQAEPRREPRPPPLRAAHRKYMTVPARRSIPNVTRSTGVQTSPDLRKCYQTFPLDRKRSSLKGLPAAEAFRGRAGGPAMDAREREEARPWAGGRVQTTAALVLRSDEQVDVLEPPAGLNCAERCRTPEDPSCLDAPRQPASRSASRGPGSQPPPGPDQGPEDAQEPAPLAHGRLFKTELAAVYAPAPEPGLVGSAAASQWSLYLAADEERGREAHLNGLQAAPGVAPACSPPAPCRPPEWNGQPPPPHAPPGEESRQIVPHTEVVGLKAQLQVMENLISSSQETIKVLLGVIQELEKGEAHREGLSYRTGQDTTNCDTCRNSACIIYSVELDFKQQEDKLQPVLRKLHPLEEAQVSPSPYSQETHATAPKQRSKTESKKHGRWKLWFL